MDEQCDPEVPALTLLDLGDDLLGAVFTRCLALYQTELQGAHIAFDAQQPLDVRQAGPSQVRRLRLPAAAAAAAAPARVSSCWLPQVLTFLK